jgi:Fe-S-cluster formation regulator IscX/YfhJ
MQELLLNEVTRSYRQWSWSERNKARAKDIESTMYELRKYWPMSVRQVFYRLISSNLIKQGHWFWKGKQVDIYKALDRTLKWMRIDELLPWYAITDDHRTTTPKTGFTDPKDFIAQELGDFLEGYARCNAQKQENYIEVWIEKAALLHITKPIADSFCRRVVVFRGYNSVTFQTQFYERATEAISRGQRPVVLYFGDFDPSGVNMIYAAMQTLIDELDLYGAEYYRAGINPEHFHMIPADPVPLKPKDSRTRRFVKEYGKTAYELDAFHPEQLQGLVRESIKAFTDMTKYEENEGQEFLDGAIISEIKDETLDFVQRKMSDFDLS